MNRPRGDLDRARRWLVRAALVGIAIVILAPLVNRLMPLVLFLLAVAVIISVLRR